jgi:pyruvate dehydrogenase E1 component
MAFIRILTSIVRDKQIGKNVVPIVPDEARTFGMEGMFRQIGIYSSKGQLYTPQDADQLMFYREDKKGQILEEGINEAGAFCSWLAAGTSYSNHDQQMIPFYIYYSMFGFQRIGDFVWAGGDMQSRGFLIGGTAGRTTLAGEGLQHQDGHSLISASSIPNCVAYDPTYAYELAVIIHDGLRRMMGMQENIFYYITCMNENYIHPALPKGSEAGILKGMYLLREGKTKDNINKPQLMGSGTILREVINAADILLNDYDISSDIWSVTSFNELRREALEKDRLNQLNPGSQKKLSYVERCLKGRSGPFIAATDYMTLLPDQIQKWIPGSYTTLGTDGYGRSDGRSALRDHFEVDSRYIVLATLNALCDQGEIDQKIILQAMKKFKINPKKPDPVKV